MAPIPNRTTLHSPRTPSRLTGAPYQRFPRQVKATGLPELLPLLFLPGTGCDQGYRTGATCVQFYQPVVAAAARFRDRLEQPPAPSPAPAEAHTTAVGTLTSPNPSAGTLPSAANPETSTTTAGAPDAVGLVQTAKEATIGGVDADSVMLSSEARSWLKADLDADLLARNRQLVLDAWQTLE